MASDAENEVKKKWAIHCAKIEQEKLLNCLDGVMMSIENASLEKQTKQVLISFYSELKSHYKNQSTEDLVNHAKALQEYSESYLENHNILLLEGILAQEKIPAYERSIAIETLQHAPLQLREKGCALNNALKAVEPYAVKRHKKLDEDFYADDSSSLNHKL